MDNQPFTWQFVALCCAAGVSLWLVLISIFLLMF
jgi:hypothetical protein